MMHDFALTASHVVFMDLPIVFDLDIAMRGNDEMPYRWDDDYGARFGLLRRDDPFGEVRWFDIEPCYVFHVANAYDDWEKMLAENEVARATLEFNAAKAAFEKAGAVHALKRCKALFRNSARHPGMGRLVTCFRDPGRAVEGRGS